MTKTPPNSIHPKTRTEWRAWLEQHHTRPEGVWLVSYKKATGQPRFEYDEAVEEALCFGWIDSKGNKLDEERSMLWFAPRKRGTGWSKPNKERVERLIEAGLMTPAGLAKVEAAKRDGSWFALDAIEALEIPSDLGEALAANETAKRFFEAFPRSVKRGILEWIANAKKIEPRAKRVEETVRLAAMREAGRILRPGARFVFTTWEVSIPVPDFPPQVNDHRPLLIEAGFAVEAYEEAFDWERRQRGVYAGILASQEALIQERGEQAAGFMIQEAQQATGLLDGTDYLAYARRILVVARRG